MKRRSDEEISAPLYEYDAAIRAQYGFFAGVDEAGRGPLCGPVVVAACILDPEKPRKNGKPSLMRSVTRRWPIRSSL